MGSFITPATMSAATAHLTDRHRPIAGFKPSQWGDQFLNNNNPNFKATETLQEKANELKKQLTKEILSIADKPLIEQLQFIDAIERLGVGYHFEQEIEDALQRIHGVTDSAYDNHLFVTSLRFRLLRQHGFKASCDVFEEFISSNRSLEKAVANDIEGILSLYEACHVRSHGEDILDEALTLTSSRLESLLDQLDNSLKEHVSHALKKPLHKMPTLVDSIYHIHAYEQDPSHRKTLLRFAKVDFNLLQSFHQKELSELSRWWEYKGASKLPLRDRMVESYLWASMVYYEPHFSAARKITTLGIQIATTIDDFYDAYGTPEEIEIFTHAVQRWDKSCLNELPNDLRFIYQLLLDSFEKMEGYLVEKGRSHYIKYIREEMKLLCETYVIEASWRQNRYVPTLDEYKEIMFRNSAYVFAIVLSFLDMDMATPKEFEWAYNLPKPVQAACLVLRIMDDIGRDKVDEERGHYPLTIECYMRHYDMSYQEACKVLDEKIEQLWKDVNHAMISPIEVPFPLLKLILNLCHAVQVLYGNGKDRFTGVNQNLMDIIRSLYVNPVPISED